MAKPVRKLVERKLLTIFYIFVILLKFGVCFTYNIHQWLRHLYMYTAVMLLTLQDCGVHVPERCKDQGGPNRNSDRVFRGLSAFYQCPINGYGRIENSDSELLIDH